jgi:GntR family transcriptional regulator, transcriptional repressor for pyruvate dehydrogenase complex
MFGPAKSRRAFEDVVAQIERAILDGHLKPGQRLPPERELTEQFAVGRGTLREALRVLEYSGLIAVRKGTMGGAFVSHSSSLMVANSLKWLVRMRRISVQELSELRERLEGGAARDAARRATRSDLKRLEDIVVELRQVSKKRELWRRALDLDLQFHQKLAEASGNVLSYAVMCSLIDCMHEAFEAIPDDQGERVFRDHHRLLRQVRTGDGAGAEQTLRRHIRYFTRLIHARTGHVAGRGRKARLTGKE